MKKNNSDVKIEAKVIDYLGKKNKDTLTLNIRISGGGCCPTIEIAEIDFKKPENEDLYKYYYENGVHVFVSNTARVSAPVLKFVLKKNLLTKEVIPLGLSLKSH